MHHSQCILSVLVYRTTHSPAAQFLSCVFKDIRQLLQYVFQRILWDLGQNQNQERKSILGQKNRAFHSFSGFLKETFAHYFWNKKHTHPNLGVGASEWMHEINGFKRLWKHNAECNPQKGHRLGADTASKTISSKARRIVGRNPWEKADEYQSSIWKQGINLKSEKKNPTMQALEIPTCMSCNTASWYLS